jgi:hypothetical protein
MNPVPGAFPLMPLTVDAFLTVLVLVTVVTVLVILFMSLREVWDGYRRWEDVRCPERRQRARVLFRLRPGGEPTEVLRCSLVGRRPIDCGMACLHRGAHA